MFQLRLLCVYFRYIIDYLYKYTEKFRYSKYISDFRLENLKNRYKKIQTSISYLNTWFFSNLNINDISMYIFYFLIYIHEICLFFFLQNSLNLVES